MPKADLANVPVYVANKMREQAGYIDIINNKFPGMVRAMIPLFEREVNGIDMVSRMAENLGAGS
jgi:hypothetical protein